MSLQKISARKIEFLTLTVCSLRDQRRGQASVPRLPRLPTPTTSCPWKCSHMCVQVHEMFWMTSDKIRLPSIETLKARSTIYWWKIYKKAFKLETVILTRSKLCGQNNNIKRFNIAGHIWPLTWSKSDNNAVWSSLTWKYIFRSTYVLAWDTYWVQLIHLLFWLCYPPYSNRLLLFKYITI